MAGPAPAICSSARRRAAGSGGNGRRKAGHDGGTRGGAFGRWAVLLAVLVLAARPAWAGDPMPLLAAGDFVAARAAVAGMADPVARLLVRFYRLLTEGAATPSEIAAFRAAHPDWPDQGVLARRFQQALAADNDPADAVKFCPRARLPAALANCAGLLSGPAALRAAQEAWAGGLLDPIFARRWGARFTAADALARFRVLLRSDPAAARGLLPRLPPAARAGAEVALAFRLGAPDAAARYRALPASARAAPGLVLAMAQRLEAKDPMAAAAFWRATGFAAEAAAPPAKRAGFWPVRQVLARDLWAAGDAAGAYALADDRAQTAPGTVASSGFLAGFIALTALHRPAVAAAQFHRLAVSRAVITEAREHYWLGRAAAASGADPAGEYRAASRDPTTFYGQLAARALGLAPVALLRGRTDPPFTPAEAAAFTARPLVRAALLLAAWHQPGRARAFLLRVAALSADPATQTLAARLALALDIPSAAVFIARRAGMEGTLLPVAGWPVAAAPPDDGVAPAVILALIRQESSFDPDAVSPSGARGLMQLMPGTAAQVARGLGARVSLTALTADPARNIRLGAAYFGQLLDRFGGSLPLAVAAYNAGPRRVDQWLAVNGDPRGHPRRMIDWIERIPYPETRNYVQRVLEGVVDYLARTGTAAPALTAQWLGKGR